LRFHQEQNIDISKLFLNQKNEGTEKSRPYSKIHAVFSDQHSSPDFRVLSFLLVR